jgi:hypothetical protein
MARKNAPTELEDLMAHERNLEAQLEEIKVKREQKEKEIQDRKSFVVGRLVLDLVGTGELKDDWFQSLLKKHLKVKAERNLFGFTEAGGVSEARPKGWDKVEGSS